MNINNTTTFSEITKQFEKIENKKENKTFITKIKENKKLQKGLICLGIVSAAGIGIGAYIITHKNKPITLKQLSFNKGLATIKKTGEKYTGTIVHKTKDNCTVNLTYANSVLQEAKKFNPDNSLAYVKKYGYETGKKTTSIFKPNEIGQLEEVKNVIRKNDSIRITGKGGIIEKYFQKIGDKWHRLDEFVDKQAPHPHWDFKYKSDVETYYLQSGMDVNRFLRSGEFCNHQFTNKKIPTTIPENANKSFLSALMDAKSDNRAVIDSLDALDEFAHSYTLQKPITVYRDAPSFWMNQAKDGLLTDQAFVSTSITPGASMEGIIGGFHQPYSRYEIRLPQGTQCANLLNTTEKEILLPRNSQFRVIGDNILEYILQN